MSSIQFFSEDIDFVPKHKTQLRQWIKDSAKKEGFRIGELNFIYCTDSYLLQLNQEYLNHDTYTDIITFDHSEEEGRLFGDVFISIERIRDNALQFQVREQDELHRVMIHGVLHLCGYGDEAGEEKKKMTEKEDHYLALRDF